jgi:hypothetical protein
VWFLLITFALFIFPGALGAVATAQNEAASAAATSEIDGLSWMNIRDSSGVPLASYTFATDRGGVLNPGATVLWAILGLEFIGYMTIVTTAIWLIGYALSFRWLDWFGSALRGVANALTGQIATPTMLVTAAAIGAFFVAWFIVRGYHAKAATQGVMMVGVAVLGPLFLADPLADVLSSNGLLAQGRNLGISVAAGLNGNSSPNPSQLVVTMQEDLADNFARRPLQVWNFGHVVDERPSCREAWSAGVLSGDEGRIKNGMKTCGDGAAHAKASNPSMGQVGTGLLLLLGGGTLVLFAVYLAVKVMRAALDTIYHGFMTIFGFAAGGFVYGPTQTFLVRNLVDGVVAAARMAAFTIFLGIYTLFLGNLFQQARGQVMAVIVVAGAVEVVAISQLKRLDQSLSRGNDWMANRFAMAIQGVRAPSAGGGGSALGMGSARAAGALPGFVTGLGALNTINMSPATAWLAGATVNPLNPLSRGRKRVDQTSIAIADSLREQHAWNHSARGNWRLKAIARSESHGGMRSALGLANALDGLADSHVPDSFVAAVMLTAGGTDQGVIDVQRALAVQKASMSQNPFGFAPLQKAVAAGRAVESHVGIDAHPAFAAQALVAADNFVRHSTAPLNPVSDHHPFVERVMNRVDDEHRLRNEISPDEWRNAGRDVRWHIGQRTALEHRDAARAYYNDQSDLNRQRLMRSTRRLSNLDHLEADAGPDPWDP